MAHWPVDNPAHNSSKALDRDLVHKNRQPLQIYSSNVIFGLAVPLRARVAALQHDCHDDETNRTCDEANR
jgi:hypothetical protein